MVTYKEQFEKLKSAYLSVNIDPWHTCFCFVGNMLNNKGDWAYCRTSAHLGSVRIGVLNEEEDSYNFLARALRTIENESKGTYTPQEIADLEAEFLYHYKSNGGDDWAYTDNCFTGTDQDEEALWIAFTVGLEKLKQIHISKGEVIEGEFNIVKRQMPE